MSCPQDCGKPHYLANYRLFYQALRQEHPGLRLISNCDLADEAPQDLYDWHMYTGGPSLPPPSPSAV